MISPGESADFLNNVATSVFAEIRARQRPNHGVEQFIRANGQPLLERLDVTLKYIVRQTDPTLMRPDGFSTSIKLNEIGYSREPLIATYRGLFRSILKVGLRVASQDGPALELFVARDPEDLGGVLRTEPPINVSELVAPEGLDISQVEEGLRRLVQKYADALSAQLSGTAPDNVSAPSTD